MKLKNILFLVLFLPSFVFSNDILFNRLSKLYQKDQDKCLVTAQRYAKYFPENPAPYYYASKVYFGKSKNARNDRAEYSLLKKVIGYAQKFERTDVNHLAERNGWAELKDEIQERVVVLSDNLSKNNQQSLSASLIISFSRLKDTDVSEVIIQAEEKDIHTNEKIEEIASSPSRAMHSGMPTGRELIPSSNHESELELLKFINDERIKRGMEPLIWEDRLANASRYHAYDLATENYFNHATHDRKNDKLVRVGGTFERIRKFYDESFVNSENIAAGNSGAYGTYQQWYTSKGHNENMFNPESRLVGIGLYYSPDAPFNYYWVFCTAR